jgi:hypothetical protein
MTLVVTALRFRSREIAVLRGNDRLCRTVADKPGPWNPTARFQNQRAREWPRTGRRGTPTRLPLGTPRWTRPRQARDDLSSASKVGCVGRDKGFSPSTAGSPPRGLCAVEWLIGAFADRTQRKPIPKHALRTVHALACRAPYWYRLPASGGQPRLLRPRREPIEPQS